MTDGSPPPTDGRRWHLAFWPVVILTSSLALSALHVLAATLHPDPVYWIGSRYDMVTTGLDRISALNDVESHKAKIVYFGDSTVAAYDGRLPLPTLTKKHLNTLRQRQWVEVANAAAPGGGITQVAFLADEVADFEPDLVIWQLSFFQFTDRWTSRNGAPELVGFVHAARLPELLMMPFQKFRLSLSDILLQQTIVRLGVHDVHRWLRESQLRFGHVRGFVEDALNPNHGRKPEARAQLIRGRGYMRRHVDMSVGNRYSAYGEQVHFGRTLDGLEPDDPKLQLLASGIRAFTRDGVDVLVYLNPTNLERIKSVGVFNEEGIATTVDAIRNVVEASGAHFLDMHDMLVDDAFADAAGHFRDDEARPVPRVVTTRVAEAVLPIIKARRQVEREAGAEASD